MTLTSALPAQAATDVLGRRMPEDLGDGSSADQSGSFPELLGQLAAHPEERALAQPAVPGKTGVQDPSRLPLPWKFRIADVLALTGGVEVLAADAAGDLQAGTTTLETVANAEDLWANVPDVAQELLAGERGGESDDTEDGQMALQSDQQLQSVPQRPVDLAGLFRVMEIAALAENGAGAGAAPSDAQVVGSKDRRSGKSAELAAAMASKAGSTDPMLATSVGDGPMLHMPSMEISDATEARQAMDQEALSIATAEAKVTVLRTETHLPPIAHAPPILQIAERLEAELTAAETGASKADDVSLPSLSVKSDSALKILHIQLQPADLGTVTVRMSLKQDALEIQLDASRQETAYMLRQDREALSKVLQSAGYALDGVIVHIVEPDRAASPIQPNVQNNHTGPQSSLQSQSGWSQPDGQSSGMQRQSGHESGRSSEPSDASVDAGNDATGARASNGGVYL